MIYVKLLCRFSLYRLSLGSHSKHHNHFNIHLKFDSLTGQPALKFVVMRKLPESSRTVGFCIKNESVWEDYSRTLFANNVQEDCLYIKKQLKATQSAQYRLQEFCPKAKGSVCVVYHTLCVHLQTTCASEHTIRPVILFMINQPTNKNY